MSSGLRMVVTDDRRPLLSYPYTVRMRDASPEASWAIAAIAIRRFVVLS